MNHEAVGGANNSMNRRSGSRWLVVFLFIAMVSQNYFDLIGLLEGNQLALYAYEGPIFAKLGKDICYFLILVAIVVDSIRSKSIQSVGITSFIFCLILILMTISAYFNGFIIAILGFRWFLPFLIFLLIAGWAKKIDQCFFANFIFFALVGCLLLQVAQLFFMPPVYGELIWGLAARTPGYFLAPNSAAFFGCSSAALILVTQRHQGKKAIASLVIAFFISALAQSGTGLIVSILLLLWYFIYPNLSILIINALFWCPVIFLYLNLLTGRDDYVELSGGGRLEVLEKVFFDSIFSIATFGKYTNAANLISDDPQSQVAADSLIAAWIGNFGILWPMVSLLVVIFIITNMHQYRRYLVVGPLLVFVLFSATTIVFEAFPMNIILGLAIWWARSLKPVQKSE